MKNIMERTWISPFVALSFFVVSMTGILMLTHARSGLINSLHEWMGVLLIIFGVIHLAINWKAFVACFRNRHCLVAVVAVAAVILLLCFGGIFSLDGGSNHSGGNGYSRGFSHRY